MADKDEPEVVKRAKVAETYLAQETKRQKPKTGTEQYVERDRVTPEQLEAEGKTTKAAILRKLEDLATYNQTHRNDPEVLKARETNQKYVFGPVEKVTGAATGDGRGQRLEDAAKRAAQYLQQKGYNPNPHRIGKWLNETAQDIDEGLGAQHKPVAAYEPDYIDLDEGESPPGLDARGVRAEPGPQEEVQQRMKEVQERLDSIRRAQEVLKNPESKNWTKEQWIQWTEATRK